jgi:hypothetical protein
MEIEIHYGMLRLTIQEQGAIRGHLGSLIPERY